MSPQRGTAYTLAAPLAPDTVCWLVVTNDLWNQRMGTVAAVPLRVPDRTPSSVAPLATADPPLQAVPGTIVSFETKLLGHAHFVLAPDELAAVENALRELLVLPQLLGPKPTRPRSPPGPANYPRWGELYYAGDRIGGERKRYVVVSNDYWNQVERSAIFVRTTTQRKRWTDPFPHIQRGAAQACCGDLTFFTVKDVDMVTRPSPSLLGTADMVAIARGLADVLSL